jgi:uncharacterized membrane protein
MDIKEHKKKFQLERLILFSDAVFAIAITLLVIELKLPELEETSERAMANALAHTIPHFIAFILSFAIIGIYWVAHHRMFYYVVNYDNRLLWLNLLLLMFVVLMPFSSYVYGIHSAMNVAFLVYTVNISMLAFCMVMMYGHISNPKRNLSHGLENKRLVRYYQLRSAVVPLCFVVGVVIAFTANNFYAEVLSRMSPVLIAPAIRLLRRRYKDVNAEIPVGTPF